MHLTGVIQGMLAELSSGSSSLRFGASTRVYTLAAAGPDSGSNRKRPLSHSSEAPSAESGEGPAQSRGRVRFADAANGADGLEKIIGYSDGRSFAVNVGPSAMDGSLKGQFGDLVKPSTLEASLERKSADQVDGIQPHTGRKQGVQEQKRPRHVQPLLATSSSGLYDMLPSPTSRTADPV